MNIIVGRGWNDLDTETSKITNPRGFATSPSNETENTMKKQLLLMMVWYLIGSP